MLMFELAAAAKVLNGKHYYYHEEAQDEQG